MSKPDILIFFSDQHNAMYNGFAGNNIVTTPNLDYLAENGTVFDAAYTSCPLCVPARSSFLTGQLGSTAGIFENHDALPSDQPTFLHSLAAEGYETVLCGRMHFRGEDQRHGFTKRIMGDILPAYWISTKSLSDFGHYGPTVAMSNCLDIIGGGNSPVLEYDRAVINTALEYLKQKNDKPLCLVIGTFAPHFPFVCPPDLYEYYGEIVTLPESMESELEYDHPIMKQKEQRVKNDKILKARAAYMGMVTNLDKQVGMVHSAWKEYLERDNRKGLFVYLSDHGEQAGERYLFGKQTFFEGSARIPLIFEGDGVLKGKRINGPVNITDICPTLCELTGSLTPPGQDGISILKQITTGIDEPKRHVLSEYIDSIDDRIVPGRMIRQGKWKLISYSCYDEYDLLFNLEEDPCELKNVISENRETALQLKKLLTNNWNIDAITKEFKRREENIKILSKWSRSTNVKDPERWIIPGHARQFPQIS